MRPANRWAIAAIACRARAVVEHQLVDEPWSVETSRITDLVLELEAAACAWAGPPPEPPPPDPEPPPQPCIYIPWDAGSC